MVEIQRFYWCGSEFCQSVIGVVGDPKLTLCIVFKKGKKYSLYAWTQLETLAQLDQSKSNTW